jgi:hypothetical protein
MSTSRLRLTTPSVILSSNCGSLESIEASIERVLEAPTRWRVIDDDVRRCLAHVFPYGILYTIEADFILIVAVMHFSREPDYWKGRLEIA